VEVTTDQERGFSAMTHISRFLKDESGATAIEYGMVIGGIALALVVAINTLGDTTAGKYLALANIFS